MYQFSQRFKITTLILMGLGLLGLGYGFMSAPSTIEEAKAMMASHEGGHGEEHGSADHPTLAEAHHGNILANEKNYPTTQANHPMIGLSTCLPVKHLFIAENRA